MRGRDAPHDLGGVQSWVQTPEFACRARALCCLCYNKETTLS